jgi:hypothetical protein
MRLQSLISTGLFCKLSSIQCQFGKRVPLWRAIGYMAIQLENAPGQPGYVHLIFDRRIDVDSLRLAFCNRISRTYLDRSVNKANWSPARSHFFEAVLVSRGDATTVFCVGPEVTTFIPDETIIELTNSDGAVSEVVVWRNILLDYHWTASERSNDEPAQVRTTAPIVWDEAEAQRHDATIEREPPKTEQEIKQSDLPQGDQGPRERPHIQVDWPPDRNPEPGEPSSVDSPATAEFVSLLQVASLNEAVDPTVQQPPPPTSRFDQSTLRNVVVFCTLFLILGAAVVTDILRSNYQSPSSSPSRAQPVEPGPHPKRIQVTLTYDGSIPLLVQIKCPSGEITADKSGSSQSCGGPLAVTRLSNRSDLDLQNPAGGDYEIRVIASRQGSKGRVPDHVLFDVSVTLDDEVRKFTGSADPKGDSRFIYSFYVFN